MLFIVIYFVSMLVLISIVYSIFVVVNNLFFFYNILFFVVYDDLGYILEWICDYDILLVY